MDDELSKRIKTVFKGISAMKIVQGQEPEMPP
jgi:hypothetical protein